MHIVCFILKDLAQGTSSNIFRHSVDEIFFSMLTPTTVYSAYKNENQAKKSHRQLAYYYKKRAIFGVFSCF